jgi:hypothetical protein
MHDTEATVQPSPEVRARAMASAVLRACRLGSTQCAIAEAMKVSESTLSNMLSKELDRFCLLLALVGLKTVPTSARCFPADYVQALHVMAKMQMQSSSPDQLDWEDSTP